MIGTAFFDDEVPGKRPGVMCSRNLSVPDFVRRFFVSCAQISEAYAVRTLMKFGCGWRKISHEIKRKKDSESTFLKKEDLS